MKMLMLAGAVLLAACESPPVVRESYPGQAAFARAMEERVQLIERLASCARERERQAGLPCDGMRDEQRRLDCRRPFTRACLDELPADAPGRLDPRSVLPPVPRPADSPRNPYETPCRERCTAHCGPDRTIHVDGQCVRTCEADGGGSAGCN